MDITEISKNYSHIKIIEKIIIELKAVEEIAKEYEVQLINYLQATKKEVGLLLNFGFKLQMERKILSKRSARI